MTNQQEPLNAGDYLPDVREILMTLWRQRTLVVTIGAAITVLGFLYVLAQPTYYRATATLLVQDESVKLTSDFTDVTQGDKFSDLTVQTNVKVLTSPAIALQTIKAAGLDKVREFARRGDDERRILQRFASKLTVAQQGSSRVIEVGFKSRDPELAARIVNAHIDSFLNSQIDTKRARVEQLRKWFETKVEDLKADVIKKSEIVSQFRAKEGLAVGKDSQELIYQTITDTAAQLVPLQVHEFDLKSKLKAIEDAKASGQPEALVDVVKSPVIGKLKEQESLIAQETQGMRAKYGPNHPALIGAGTELGQVRAAINAEVNNIVGSLQNDLDSTLAQEAMLNTQLETLKKEADGLRIKLITLKSLVVEQEASQKLLDSFLANYENIQSQVSFARPDAMIASPAIAPLYPAKPGKKMMMVIVLIFAGAASFGTVFVIEMMKGGMRNFDDIRNLNLTPLGIIPQTNNPVAVMRSPINSSLKESIKRIYMSGLMNSSVKTILVTSALPKEGRTTFVTLLGYYLTSIGHKVLVIDADFLRPSLGNLVGAASGPGFTDLLAGRAPLSAVLRQDQTGLTILGAGTKAALTPDTLRIENLKQVFAQLKAQFTYILIDSGPILAHTEATALGTQADGIIVVTEWLKTSERNMGNMLATLKTINTPVIGVALNHVDIEKYKDVTTGSDFLFPRIDNAA